MILSIAQIVAAGGYAAIKEMKQLSGGSGARFVDAALNEAHETGDVEVVLALTGELEQIHVPVTWTFGDEAKHPLQNDKIAFVKDLMEAGVESLDALLVEQLEDNKLTVLNNHCYWIGPVTQVPGQPASYFMLSAAFTKTPKVKQSVEVE